MKRKDYAKKIIFSFVCLIVVVVLNFFLPRLMPGDPVLMLVGGDEDLFTKELYDFYFHKLGLDLPLGQQFLMYLKDLFSGNLGYSYQYGDSVAKLIAERIPTTLQIALPSIFISSFLALWLGMNAGYKKNSFLDKTLTTTSIILNSVPTFFMALILMIVFSFKFRIFPFGGLNSIIIPESPIKAFGDRLLHLFLPILTLVIVSTPSKFLMMKNTTAIAMDEKYVLYAKSRGISNSKIKIKYIFRNICQPFITMVGMGFGRLFSGSLVIEMVFSIPGMGMLMSSSISKRDYAVLQGCLFLMAIMVIFANLITDIICILSDPKSLHGENYDG